jgi:hypothetical protein
MELTGGAMKVRREQTMLDGNKWTSVPQELSQAYEVHEHLRSVIHLANTFGVVESKIPTREKLDRLKALIEAGLELSSIGFKENRRRG